MSAPRVYASVQDVVHFWKIKEAVAQGRPFQADKDIFTAALDIIMAVSFGVPREEGNIAHQILCLEEQSKSDGGPADVPYPFEGVSLKAESQACVDLVESLAVPINSVFSVLSHRRHLRKPHMRRATAMKNELVRRSIEAGVRRMEDGAETKSSVERCAVDQLVARESTMAAKRGLAPDYFRQSIQDEVRAILLCPTHSKETYCG